MENIHTRPRQHVFIVRIWKEAIDQGHSELRGRVEYLSNERPSMFFRSLESFNAFLEEILLEHERDARFSLSDDSPPDQPIAP